MLFSLYNSKIDVFRGIFEAENEDSAEKMFIELLNSPRPNEVTQYPDEFILFKLGDFDKSSGTFDLLPSPLSVITGLQAVKMLKERKRLLDDLYGTEDIQNPPAEQKDIKMPVADENGVLVDV